MVSRAPFGQNGNRLVALFNWGTQVGFEIEGVYFVVVTVLLLFARGHTTLNGSGKVGIIILAVAVQAALPLLGHATISKIFRYMAYVFIVFFVVLAVFVFQRVHLSTFHVHPATLAVWTTALVLLTSVGGLGWTENGNDYSRYLPRSTPGYKTFWAAALGGAIPSILLEILGVLAYTVTTKTVGPAELPIPQTFASWFVVPFLIFAILQLLAINTVDLYSSGVTLQALGVPVKRWGAVIIDSVVCGVVVGIIVFHGNFYADFAGFLLYIIVWLSAWFGVFITDYVLRRRRYDPASLAAERGGLYWRNGGVHWPAIIALAAGMVAALMWINAAYDVPSYTGPISNHFPGLAGGDFSWALGIIVSSLVYWALAARGVRKEADATPDPSGLTAAAPEAEARPRDDRDPPTRSSPGCPRPSCTCTSRAPSNGRSARNWRCGTACRYRTCRRSTTSPRSWSGTTRACRCCWSRPISTTSPWRTSARRGRRTWSTRRCSSIRRRTPAGACRSRPSSAGSTGPGATRFDQLGLRAQLIMCFLRDLPADSAMETLAQSLPYADKIVGVGLDSDEWGNPPLKFAGVFARARAEGYRLTMHCDVDQEDAVGHIWQCVDEIGVERIDHGVNCLEDAALVARLAADRIGLTVCPVSNGWVTDSMKVPELAAMLDKTLLATVNSDDPAYFEAYVNENFAAVAADGGLTTDHLTQLARNSFEIAWLRRRRARGLPRPDRLLRRRRAERPRVTTRPLACGVVSACEIGCVALHRPTPASCLGPRTAGTLRVKPSRSVVSLTRIMPTPLAVSTQLPPLAPL